MLFLYNVIGIYSYILDITEEASISEYNLLLSILLFHKKPLSHIVAPLGYNFKLCFREVASYCQYSTYFYIDWCNNTSYVRILIRYICMYYYCTDDPDDGMELPVQLPPTDDERAGKCICKPHPTLPIPTPTLTLSSLMTTSSPSFIPTPSLTLMPSPSPTEFLPPTTGITVIFNASSYSRNEDGVIALTVFATGVSPEPYNVTITLSELLPVSVRELFDYLNETIVVTFNPGEFEKTVLFVVNPDCTREGSEYFNLTLSLDPAAMDLGITLGDPSMAVAEIENIDGKKALFVINKVTMLLFTVIHVNFSQPVYSAEEADERMIIKLQADCLSIWSYSVEINIMEILPVGVPGKLIECLTSDFVSLS